MQTSSVYIAGIMSSFHTNAVMPIVTIAVVCCANDESELSMKIAKSSTVCPNTVCRRVEVDKIDMDEACSVIQNSDIAIIVLSANFVLASMAFQTVIFILRSIRKPARFINLMSSYMNLVGNEDYAKSSISLLVGNAMIYSSWSSLMLEWAAKYKNTTTSSAVFNTGPLPPLENITYLTCRAKDDDLKVNEIISAMPDYHFYDLKQPSDVTSAVTPAGDGDDQQCCALVFVSYALAVDKAARAVLDEIIRFRVPMVVIVITDPSNKSWMQTGLGIILSNELWVDFSVAPFYKPGEVVPSFRKRLRKLSIRLRNALIPQSKAGGILRGDEDLAPLAVGKATSTDAAEMMLIEDMSRVFVSHCWADSDIKESDFQNTGLAHFSNKAWRNPHSPVKHANELSKHFRVDLDVTIRQDTRDYFQVTAERLYIADTALLFWSTSYVQSFFCYNEAFQSLVWQHKRVVVVFIESFNEVISALRTMPQHDLLLPRILTLEPCMHSGKPFFASPSLCGLNASGMPFEQIHEELICALSRRARLEVPPGIPRRAQTPGEAAVFDVLVSYCWSNSLTAFHRGFVSSVEGGTDPIALTAEIERFTGLRCWLDVNELGSEGLFKGIHAALSCKSLKCVILCVSDEYARSPNCMMELEYAIRRIPCIVISVGNGYAWRTKLAGYFVAYQETFDFVLSPFPHSEGGVILFNSMVTRLSEICTAGAKVTTTALR